MLNKTLAAGTIVLTLAGAGIALAQHAPRDARDMQGVRPSAEDRAAFTDARIAALKAGLQLNAEQEKNWPAVETAIRDLAKERADRMNARAERWRERREARQNSQNGDEQQHVRRGDIIERLGRSGDAMAARGAALKKLADAAAPLYNSLDDAQKRRFAVLLQMNRHGRHHHHFQRRADNERFDNRDGGHRGPASDTRPNRED